ncbi:MAG: DUF1761 domain-containing protein [Bacteroidota bacterium]
MENIHVNMVAILVAVVANFVLGFIWYTPLFGKVWGKEMGFKMDEKPPTSSLVKGMVIMIIGNFLMAFVFAHNMAVWDPTTWGLPPSPMSMMSTVMSASVFTWLGFYVPVDLNTVAWEGRSWKLFFINTGYHFLSLFVAALILVNMK